MRRASIIRLLVPAGGLHDVRRRHHLRPRHGEAAFRPEEGAGQRGACTAQLPATVSIVPVIMIADCSL